VSHRRGEDRITGQITVKAFEKQLSPDYVFFVGLLQLRHSFGQTRPPFFILDRRKAFSTRPSQEETRLKSQRTRLITINLRRETPFIVYFGAIIFPEGNQPSLSRNNNEYISINFGKFLPHTPQPQSNF